MIFLGVQAEIDYALATEHLIDPNRGWDQFDALDDRISPSFSRYEPLRRPLYPSECDIDRVVQVAG